MIKNILLGILLSITIFISLFSFTILNKNYIKHIEKKESIRLIDQKKDLKINNKYIIYVVNIGLIILTGELFVHTKKKHDLNRIYVVSFFTMIIIYGICHFCLNQNNLVTYKCYRGFLHYYLGFEIILFLYVIFKKYLLNKILK